MGTETEQVKLATGFCCHLVSLGGTGESSIFIPNGHMKASNDGK